MTGVELTLVLVVALVLGVIATRVLGALARLSLYIVIGLVVLFLLQSLRYL